MSSTLLWKISQERYDGLGT